MKLSRLLLIYTTIFVGVISFLKFIPKENSQPENTLTLETEYFGMGPEKIEEVITLAFEEKISLLGGIEEIFSISEEGKSRLFIKLSKSRDQELAAMEIREKVEEANLRFPGDVQKPVLHRFNSNSEPIFAFYLQNNANDSEELEGFAEKEIKPQLESISGIASVQIGGKRQKEIQIIVNPEVLPSTGLSFSSIARFISSENFNLSAGKLDLSGNNISINYLGNIKNVNELENIVLVVENSSILKLGDIAKVKLDKKEKTSSSRISGKERISIYVYSSDSFSSREFSSSIKKFLDDKIKPPLSYNIILDKGEKELEKIILVYISGFLFLAGIFIFQKTQDLKIFILYLLFDFSFYLFFRPYISEVQISELFYFFIWTGLSFLFLNQGTEYLRFILFHGILFYFISTIFQEKECSDISLSIAFSSLSAILFFHILEIKTSRYEAPLSKEFKYKYIIFIIIFLVILGDLDTKKNQAVQTDEIYGRIELPPDSSFMLAEKITQEAEEKLSNWKKVENISSRIEGNSPGLYIKLKNFDSKFFLEKEAEKFVSDLSAGFIYFGSEGDSNNLEVDVFGEDLKIIDSIAKELSERSSRISGINKSYLRYKAPREELFLAPEKNPISQAGLNSDFTAREMRYALFGGVVSKYYSSDSEIDIHLRGESRNKIPEMNFIQDENRLHSEIAFSKKESFSHSRIYRKNKRRTFGLTFKIDSDKKSEIINELNILIKEIPRPENYTIEIYDYENKTNKTVFILLLVASSILLNINYHQSFKFGIINFLSSLIFISILIYFSETSTSILFTPLFLIYESMDSKIAMNILKTVILSIIMVYLFLILFEKDSQFSTIFFAQILSLVTCFCNQYFQKRGDLL